MNFVCLLPFTHPFLHHGLSIILQQGLENKMSGTINWNHKDKQGNQKKMKPQLSSVRRYIIPPQIQNCNEILNILNQTLGTNQGRKIQLNPKSCAWIKYEKGNKGLNKKIEQNFPFFPSCAYLVFYLSFRWFYFPFLSHISSIDPTKMKQWRNQMV